MPDPTRMDSVDEDRNPGLPMSSTYDLLSALVEVGALRLAGSRTYALGPRAVRLGLVLADSVQLHKVAAPHLRALAQEVDENVYLGVRVGGEVVYADRYEVSQTLSVVMALGESRPLHGSASGKLLTAHDPELEEQVLGASRLEPLTPHTRAKRPCCAGCGVLVWAGSGKLGGAEFSLPACLGAGVADAHDVVAGGPGGQDAVTFGQVLEVLVHAARHRRR